MGFPGTLTSVAGNARLATGDIATEVGRPRDQPPGTGVVSIGGAGLAADASRGRLTESKTLSSLVVYLRYQRIR